MADKSQTINSIVRALNLLELYGKLNVQALGITDISRELGMQKTTAFNIAKTLQQQGWLVQNEPNGKYTLGTRILSVSSMVTQSFSIENLLLQEMRRLRDQYNEDVVLTAMVDDLPICVEKVQSSNVLRIQSKVGKVSNLICGSTGKALFAWQPPEFIEETLCNLCHGDVDQMEEIRRQLEIIRRQGYCISVSEQDQGVASVSVPILDRNGYAVYSLAIIGEEHRIYQKGIDDIREEMVATSKRLGQERSLMLGWHAD